MDYEGKDKRVGDPGRDPLAEAALDIVVAIESAWRWKARGDRRRVAIVSASKLLQDYLES